MTGPVVVTGADRPMGAALCRGLSAAGEVNAIGESPGGTDPGGAVDYRSVDLRLPPGAREALQGAAAIVHAQPHGRSTGETSAPEAELLDVLSRGTYVLVQAAREAGIGRIVLVSPISLMQDYPADYIVEPWWRPRPRPDGESLAPYLAELVCREIARTGAIEVRCLRMGDLDDPEGTSTGNAVGAVSAALQSEAGAGGYSWHVDHVLNSGPFAGGS